MSRHPYVKEREEVTMAVKEREREEEKLANPRRETGGKKKGKQ